MPETLFMKGLRGGWENIIPLGVAVHYGELEAAKALVDVGANVNTPCGQMECTLSGHREPKEGDRRLSFPEGRELGGELQHQELEHNR